MKLSKRFVDRARPALRRYQKILQSAHGRDCNESDTAVIVADLLAEVLGWDKYREVTTEFAVRSTFCDLALKVDGKVSFLIEVKCIGTDLKDNHLRQATDYAANSGIEWVLLANGILWHAHRMRFEQPVRSDEVFVLDLLDPSCKPADILATLYLISREGVGPDAIGKFWQQKEATSRREGRPRGAARPGVTHLERRAELLAAAVARQSLTGLVEGQVRSQAIRPQNKTSRFCLERDV